jgi:hypothetical protein
MEQETIYPITLLKHLAGTSSQITQQKFENLPNNYVQIIEEYVQMIQKTSPRDIKKWCRQNNPTLCVFNFDNNVEYMYSYKSGYIGQQYQLFPKD